MSARLVYWAFDALSATAPESIDGLTIWLVVTSVAVLIAIGILVRKRLWLAPMEVRLREVEGFYDELVERFVSGEMTDNVQSGVLLRRGERLVSVIMA